LYSNVLIEISPQNVVSKSRIVQIVFVIPAAIAVCQAQNKQTLADRYAVVLKVRMPRKDPAAVRLGRKGGRATAGKLTAEQRKESARKAAKARWAKARKKVAPNAGE